MNVARACLSVLALATALAVATPSFAMPDDEHTELLKRVKAAKFSGDVRELIKIASKSHTFSSAQVKALLDVIKFENDKLKALRILAPRLEDPSRKDTILATFKFKAERKRGAAALDELAPKKDRAPQDGSRALVTRDGKVIRFRDPAFKGWATEAYKRMARTWPDKHLETTVTLLKAAKSGKDRRRILEAAVAGRNDGITGEQTRRVLEAFGFNSEMVKAIDVLDPAILGLSCDEVTAILKDYKFESSRLKVLEKLADTIIDPENRFKVLDAFKFSAEKKRANRILEKNPGRSPLWGWLRSGTVVFVVDMSGSMSTTAFRVGRSKVSRMDYVRFELSRAFEMMPAGARFNIVAFADTANRWQRKAVRATSSNKLAALSFVSGLKPWGGTNIDDALDLALGEKGVTGVYFLTDGAPTAGKIQDPVELVRSVKARVGKRKLPIHGIALLMGKDPGDDALKSASIVCGLAEETHGLCRVLK